MAITKEKKKKKSQELLIPLTAKQLLFQVPKKKKEGLQLSWLIWVEKRAKQTELSLSKVVLVQLVPTPRRMRRERIA